MRGYDSKEARAGHRYNMSEKHKKRESEGMKRYWEDRKGSGRHEREERHGEHDVLRHHNKYMYGVNTMSEDYDMGRIDVRKQTLRGEPPEAWDYKY